MKRRSIGSALLLVAWLVPVFAQLGVLIDLLDAGRVAHSPTIVELLVHGHSHGRQVPAHHHTVRAESTTREVVLLQVAAMVSGPLSPTRVFAYTPGGLFCAAFQALDAAPLRHILFGVLLR